MDMTHARRFITSTVVISMAVRFEPYEPAKGAGLSCSSRADKPCTDGTIEQAACALFRVRKRQRWSIRSAFNFLIIDPFSMP